MTLWRVRRYGEHGSLHSCLRKRAADGTPFPVDDKMKFCCEIANGMMHLVKCKLIHRDLAART